MTASKRSPRMEIALCPRRRKVAKSPRKKSLTVRGRADFAGAEAISAPGRPGGSEESPRRVDRVAANCQTVRHGAAGYRSAFEKARGDLVCGPTDAP